MTKSILRTFFVLTLLQYSITPSVYAQLTKLKTSYSALTANMAARQGARIVGLHPCPCDFPGIEAHRAAI